MGLGETLLAGQAKVGRSPCCYADYLSELVGLNWVERFNRSNQVTQKRIIVSAGRGDDRPFHVVSQRVIKRSSGIGQLTDRNLRFWDPTFQNAVAS